MLMEVQQMGSKRPYYTPEFKAEAVQLVLASNKPIKQVAKDIGVSDSALRKWVRQAEIDEGKGEAGTLKTSEREELNRLRRDIRQIKMERDFLKKSVAFFARENS
jgi:transposase